MSNWGRVVVAALLLLAVPGADARDLSIGLGRAVTSIDPQFHASSGNNMIAAHLFDRLVHQDERQRLVPGLAESWRLLAPTAWEFKLRPGVRFHDGSPFEAEDVIASFERVEKMPSSPSSFAFYTRPIATIEKIDSHTVRFTTRRPYPLLPYDIGSINIVPRHLREATTAEFDSGRAVIGTGPYRLVSWQRDSELVLERNDSRWSERGPWARVRMRIMISDPTRVAALLAGDVQAIEFVPSADLGRLAVDDRFDIVRHDANRVILLNLDQHRAVTPFATTHDGQPLGRNPFLDRRVRQAISKSINRAALVATIQEGVATQAGTVVSPILIAGAHELEPDAHDPAAARRLLAESGYPNGFALILHGPNDRYPNDEKVLLAIGQMLARVGIQVQVATMPFAVFGARAARLEFSAMLNGYGGSPGEPSRVLRQLLGSINRERGSGSTNRGGYSNPALDHLLERILSTMDETARAGLIIDAARLARDDAAIVPLYFQQNVWALRKDLTYVGRIDDHTLAWLIRPRP